MRLKSPFTIVLIGVFVMTLGVTSSFSAQIQVIGLVMGFLITVSGVLLGVKETFVGAPRSKSNRMERDNPTAVRIVGAVIALLSLGTPYFETPLSPSSGETYSLVDLFTAVQQGAAFEGSFLLLLLAAVVVAGSFLSIFHHVGGYVMLLGGMTFVFMSLKSIGSFTVVQRELQFGLYLVLFAAIIIISSSLTTPETGISSESDWA